MRPGCNWASMPDCLALKTGLNEPNGPKSQCSNQPCSGPQSRLRHPRLPQSRRFTRTFGESCRTSKPGLRPYACTNMQAGDQAVSVQTTRVAGSSSQARSASTSSTTSESAWRRSRATRFALAHRLQPVSKLTGCEAQLGNSTRTSQTSINLDTPSRTLAQTMSCLANIRQSMDFCLLDSEGKTDTQHLTRGLTATWTSQQRAWSAFMKLPLSSSLPLSQQPDCWSKRVTWTDEGSSTAMGASRGRADVACGSRR
jgi:hypothetical protein